MKRGAAWRLLSQPEYKQDFIDFNTAWILDNFGFLEEEDKATFDRIEEIKLDDYAYVRGDRAFEKIIE